MLLSKACEEGWFQADESCYMISPTKMTWYQGQQFCLNQRGYLAEIISGEEEDLLDQYLVQNVLYWLGLSDSDKEGNSMFIFNIINLKELIGMFVWSRSQQALQYDNWNTGEPRSYEERDCVFKEFDFLPGHRGWSVYNCDSQTNANGWPIHALCQTTPASHA